MRTLLAAFIPLMVLLVSCGETGPTPTPTSIATATPAPTATATLTPTPTPSPDEVLARITPAVVGVGVGPDWGTGMVIREDGYILTALQLVDGASEIRVRLPDGTELAAELQGKDLGRGLAVIMVDATGLFAVPVDGFSLLAEGDPVLMLGHGVQPDAMGSMPSGDEAARLGPGATFMELADDAPAVMPPLVFRGAVSALLDADRFAPALIRTDLPVSSGTYGGPLLAEHGQLVGVVVPGGAPPAGEAASYAVKLDAGTDFADRMIQGETICQPSPRVSEDVNSYSDTGYGWIVDLPLGFSFRNLVTDMVHVYNFYDFAPSLTAASYSVNAPGPPSGRFAFNVSVFVNEPVHHVSASNAREYLIATAAELNEGDRFLKFLAEPRNVCVGLNTEAYEVELLWTEYAPKLGADYEIGGFDYISRVRWLAVESGDGFHLLQGVAWPEHFDSVEWKMDTVLYSFRTTEWGGPDYGMM
jgi:S1-C subfamily serine protease